jgi:hypothetical protein
MQKNGIFKYMWRGAVFAAALCFTGTLANVGGTEAFAKVRDEADYAFSGLSFDISDNVVMAYWDRSQEDQRYRVSLYKDTVSKNTRIGQPVTVSSKDHYDFTKRILEQGAGDYIFTVEGLKYSDMQTSEVLHLSWEEFYEIDDRYRDEHPVMSDGVYRAVNPVNLAERGAGQAGNGGTRSAGNMSEQGTRASAGTSSGTSAGVSTSAGVHSGTTAAASARSGWVKLDNGDWYHFSNGKMDTGWWQDPADGVWYYLKQDGVMTTGWLRIDGITQQFDASGEWISA